MVLESGLELVRCSKYLLIEQIIAILGEVYFIEKYYILFNQNYI